MSEHNFQDTIVAVSTPVGEGGIGIVRLSGKHALKISDEFFAAKDGKKPSSFRTYTTHYGCIIDRATAKKRTTHDGQRTTDNPEPLTSFGLRPASNGAGFGAGEIVDEVILTVMKAPKSYTREDIVEINCHGGIHAVKKVLELSLRCGARLAEPGEFTKRAFLNGRIDLAQAEAVLDTIRARTDSALKVAIHQLEGGLSENVGAILEAVVDIASDIEASIDFPDEDLEPDERGMLVRKAKNVLGRLKSLIDTYSGGMVFREGVLAIICGKPNVGKSSLMNLLLKRDRVIVSPVPGTTRDTVEEMINLKGVPIRLVDTAGIIDSEDAIEKEGVKRTKKYLELADLIIFMLDYSTKISREDMDIIKLIENKKTLVVINKSDLPCKIDTGKLKMLFGDEKQIGISVSKKRNIDRLEKAILRMVWSGKFTQGEAAIVSNARHKALLDKTYGCMLSAGEALEKKTEPELVAIDLREAVFNLGLIIGRSVSEDVLDRIFEKFCIGK
ncbi:MAG: tRNA uridine-5-carboxymethylaminomethyl(34) synthesis GTPase MnmE [Candidatus Omnitrophota bacterium]|nr:tRNA uridine-5-carboxymethylaminomethyl(34) synthesis GTPase MnmE [Candidatus Omnitrophota bacterium]